jgi:1-acyl-sn-glycerol-3-phosphate acyltransferase
MKILYYAGWTVTRVLSKLLFRIRVSGQDHIPATGGFILATNHISWYDPPLVGSWATRQVYFFAKSELFKIPILGWAIRRTNALPVKRGTVDRKSIEVSVAVIKQGYGLTFFPEGTRSKSDHFLDPKPGLGLLAIRAACPIVPGYVHGANRLTDCFLGRNRLRVVFGEPFSPDWVAAFPDNKDGYIRLSAAVMERIGELKRSVLENKVRG